MRKDKTQNKLSGSPKTKAPQTGTESAPDKKRAFRISDIVAVVLFLSMIFGFAAAFLIVPDKSTNDFETGLQRLPDAKDSENRYKGFDYFLHGEMADDFDEYFCDQFPLRKQFVSLKALTELSFGRGLNNGVLCAGGRLATVRFDSVDASGKKPLYAEKTEFYSREHVDRMMESLKAACDNADVPVKVMLPPRTIDVIAPEIGYPTEIGDALNAQVREALGDRYIDILPVMRERDAEHRNPYYRTDHHWTAVGAYYAYEKAMEALGGHLCDMDTFDFESVSFDFKGTALRNGNYFFLKGDELQCVHYEFDDKLKVELGANLDRMAEKTGLYDFDAVDGPDPYNMYLYGKTKYTRISKPGEKRETVLVLKDSFAHSLVPYIARNYDVVMADIDLLVNPKLGTGIDISRLAEETGASRVLIEYNLQNVIENENLAYINAGVSGK